MNTKTVSGRYHILSISAHWLTLILLVAVYALIELREIYPKGSDPREAMKAWHFMLGLVVLVLVFARISLRLLFRAPAISPPLPIWQKILATTMYLALYLFLIVMPLLGWLTLNAEGKPVYFFGLLLPNLITPSESLAANFEALHETIGLIGYYLIGLHAAAALFHHYILRDDTLLRMLPWRRHQST